MTEIKIQLSRKAFEELQEIEKQIDPLYKTKTYEEYLKEKPIEALFY